MCRVETSWVLRFIHCIRMQLEFLINWYEHFLSHFASSSSWRYMWAIVGLKIFNIPHMHDVCLSTTSWEFSELHTCSMRKWYGEHEWRETRKLWNWQDHIQSTSNACSCVNNFKCTQDFLPTQTSVNNQFYWFDLATFTCQLHFHFHTSNQHKSATWTLKGERLFAMRLN